MFLTGLDDAFRAVTRVSNLTVCGRRTVGSTARSTRALGTSRAGDGLRQVELYAGQSGFLSFCLNLDPAVPPVTPTSGLAARKLMALTCQPTLAAAWQALLSGTASLVVYCLDGASGAAVRIADEFSGSSAKLTSRGEDEPPLSDGDGLSLSPPLAALRAEEPMFCLSAAELKRHVSITATSSADAAAAATFALPFATPPRGDERSTAPHQYLLVAALATDDPNGMGTGAPAQLGCIVVRMELRLPCFVAARAVMMPPLTRATLPQRPDGAQSSFHAPPAGVIAAVNVSVTCQHPVFAVTLHACTVEAGTLWWCTPPTSSTAASSRSSSLLPRGSAIAASVTPAMPSPRTAEESGTMTGRPSKGGASLKAASTPGFEPLDADAVVAPYFSGHQLPITLDPCETYQFGFQVRGRAFHAKHNASSMSSSLPATPRVLQGWCRVTVAVDDYAQQLDRGDAMSTHGGSTDETSAAALPDVASRRDVMLTLVCAIEPQVAA